MASIPYTTLPETLPQNREQNDYGGAATIRDLPHRSNNSHGAARGIVLALPPTLALWYLVAVGIGSVMGHAPAHPKHSKQVSAKHLANPAAKQATLTPTPR